MIITSAPGKLLLFGDHAVVYGQPCIATAINIRLTVSIEETDIPGIRLDTPGNGNHTFINEIIKYATSQWKLPKGMHITISSPFTGKYGFGSSSAVTVAALKALSEISGNILTSKELFSHAYKIVLNVQGVGSGFDVAAATYGNTIYYKNKGEIIEPISHPQYHLVVGYSGEKADTVKIIKEVSAKRKQYTEKTDKIFSAIGELVTQARDTFIEGDFMRLGTLLNFNQEYLRDLGVSTEKLETLISAAKQAGAWGAKLSGAGGGDCMIALTSMELKKKVGDAIVQAGGEVVNILTDAEGVRMETTDDQQEDFVVVDREDEFLGYKSRAECHQHSELIHRAVGLLIFDKKGRVLLQKRSLSKDTRPGYWTSSVGGHVKKSESYEQAMKRELQEELGIIIPFQKQGKYLQEYPYETEMQTLFTAEYEGPFYPDNQEVDQVKFFTKEELNLLFVSKTMKIAESGINDLKHVHFLI